MANEIVTKYFEQAISRWLDKEKANDEMFADQVKASGKTVEGCCNYIIQRVRESKQCGYSDDEIYGMARHFFDEDSEKDPGKQDVQRIVVSGHIELSESEKAELKRQAEKEYLRQLQEEAKKRETAQREKMKARQQASKDSAAKVVQGDLFG